MNVNLSQAFQWVETYRERELLYRTIARDARKKPESDVVIEKTWNDHWAERVQAAKAAKELAEILKAGRHDAKPALLLAHRYLEDVENLEATWESLKVYVQELLLASGDVVDEAMENCAPNQRGKARTILRYLKGLKKPCIMNGNNLIMAACKKEKNSNDAEVLSIMRKVKLLKHYKGGYGLPEWQRPI